MTGTIKNYIPKYGHGVIKCSGKEYIFTKEDVTEGFFPKYGHIVSFEADANHANKVYKIGDGLNDSYYKMASSIYGYMKSNITASPELKVNLDKLAAIIVYFREIIDGGSN